jgi:predicted amidohydrolase YtcJ|tara:strand:- start:2614 stop:4035 length:1422 start_codon:yes stop_codon:yes gene_type:complete
MLIKNACLSGLKRDVRCTGEFISEIADSLEPLLGERVTEANGGELLPGLHDHHMHFYATAALQRSIDCGLRPAVALTSNQSPLPHDTASLRHLLAEYSGDGWLRGVNYHESIAGDLDRWQLDALVSDRPVRIQHRSGKLWTLNSLAVEALDLTAHTELAGIELDDRGIPTGRLFRLDAWLREKWGQQDPLDVSVLSRQMASFGITGFTDTSATNTAATVRQFRQLCDEGEILQHAYLMGDDSLDFGHLKILLDEDNLPPLNELEARIRRAREKERGIAFHCVTHIELLFAIAALNSCADLDPHKQYTDRVEHGSVIFDDVLPMLRALNLSVITQPGFLYERGPQYQQNLTEHELAHLYRHRTLHNSGIKVGLSSDAPYGPLNPWQVMQTAVSRQSATGEVIGARDCVSPEQALAGYLSKPLAPGATVRKVAVGERADLCLLTQPWQQARGDLARALVVFTMVAGELVYAADSL